MPDRYEFCEYCYRSDDGGLIHGYGVLNIERNEIAPFLNDRDKAWQFLVELRNEHRNWSTLGTWNQEGMDVLELKHWRPGTGDQQKISPIMPGKFGFMSGEE